MVPYDQKSPFVTSGIRIGTAAATTRGIKEPAMLQIADFINKAITNADDETILATIKSDVKELCSNFPLYPELKQ